MQNCMQLPVTPLNKNHFFDNVDLMVKLPPCMKLFVDVEKVSMPNQPIQTYLAELHKLKREIKMKEAKKEGRGSYGRSLAMEQFA